MFRKNYNNLYERNQNIFHRINGPFSNFVDNSNNKHNIFFNDPLDIKSKEELSLFIKKQRAQQFNILNDISSLKSPSHSKMSKNSSEKSLIKYYFAKLPKLNIQDQHS